MRGEGGVGGRGGEESGVVGGCSIKEGREKCWRGVRGCSEEEERERGVGGVV